MKNDIERAIEANCLSQLRPDVTMQSLLLGIASKTGSPQSVYREPQNLCWLKRQM
jgi:putative ubiquitin-RnfH superfamily antitoxin RatB of RatAB toxin-antitoxin module